MGKGGGKGGGEKFRVVDYFMSVGVGLCHGPIDCLWEIKIKEKEAWQGLQYGEGGIFIDKADLFGGNKKEGGVRGVAYLLPGNDVQVLPQGIVNRIRPGQTSATMPGFRGLASLWFIGGGANFGNAFGAVAMVFAGFTYLFTGRYTGFGPGMPGYLGFPSNTGPEAALGAGGFMWGSNNPYMPAWEIGVQRYSRGLSTLTRAIQNPLTKLPDNNPAHIIFECMTNTDWGMGSPTTAFNMDSFEYAANVLHDEKFGLSLMWTQQAKIEDFVSEILDHIQATLYVNPRTGLWEIKLIRNDYDVDTLREFGPDECKLNDFQRKAWGETTNEIVVTWTNPANEQEETITQQDMANIAMQGQIVSDSRNYYGVRHPDLAAELAVRDLRTASTPLASANIEVNRKAWNVTPGEVIKLTWPDDGIDQLIMRVGKVDYGKAGAPTVRVSLVEDIFAFSVSAFYSPPSTLWEDPSQPPEPLDYVEIVTAPAPLMISAGLDVSENSYPSVRALVLGAGLSPDAREFELSGEVATVSGGSEWTGLGSLGTVGHAFSTVALAREPETLVASFPGYVGSDEGPVVDGLVLIGSGGDEAMEIALISGMEGSSWRLQRGMLDTVPRAWPIGTPLWFLNGNSDVFDGTERTPGQIEIRIQPRTSQGLLPLEETTLYADVLTDRPFLPFRPANVVVGGSTGAPRFYGAPPATVPVTWSNRNRLIEDVVMRRWTEAGVAVEAGQTTRIEIIDRDSGQPITEHVGLTGESFAIPYESFGGIGGTLVRVLAERDDLLSLQAYEIEVDIAGVPGWGNDYGETYGDGVL